MNIVHIVWGLGIGGVESMLVDIANYQIESNAVRSGARIRSP